ncbi:MAG: ATP synthase F1 subunit epsilon [Coriobacteriales bacterium]|jgi:F-type H+-transporting ATPase subunit epsilon|nr:ATP synthase F1 subunit epsilon [Coriobacteriales bacterium]
MSSVICEIVTPADLIFSEEVYSVSVPASEGEFGVLAQRAPIMSTLRDGEVRIRRTEGGEQLNFAVSGGYVEADGRKVVVLTSRAADVSTLDAAEVRTAKAAAEKRLASFSEDDSQAAFHRDELAWYSLLETLLARG